MVLDIEKHSTKKRPLSKEKSQKKDQDFLDKKWTSPEAYRAKDQDYLIQKKSPSFKKSKDPFNIVYKNAENLFKKNQLGQAEKVLKTLHAHGIKHAESYCLLGSIYHSQNKFKQALTAYKKALEIYPSYLEALINLSLLRLDLGDYGRGFMSYRLAKEALFQKNESRWRNYICEQHLHSAQIYFKKACYHEALLEFLKAYPHTKKIPPLAIDLKITQCLWKLDRKKESLDRLLKLKKTNPLSMDVCLLLGDFYFQMNKITSAINEWERVLRFDPQNSQALKWLSKIQHIQSVEEDSLA